MVPGTTVVEEIEAAFNMYSAALWGLDAFDF
jgi:hypothetical protein